MPLLGAHQSISGGYYRAIEIARQRGCECVQLFTKNNNQWRAKPISDEEAERFRSTLEQLGIRCPIGHDSYLINLATPDDALWEKSIASFAHELERADKLGLDYLVTHPGAFTTSSEEAGIERIVAAIDRVHRQVGEVKTIILLENTAGQGSALGWRFEHLTAIIQGVVQADRLGVCIDTCHTFAAGYPLATKEEYQATIAELDLVVGLSRIKAWHLNDSLKPLGSRVDRHAHIGQGQLGLEAFRHLLNDPRFAMHPMYLETAKETNDDGEDMDEVNLRVLRALIAT